jgi:uncharacterized protein YegP (UPF0339 family)
MTRPVRLSHIGPDGKRVWNLRVNGSIVATDGSQGYENKADARKWLIASSTASSKMLRGKSNVMYEECCRESGENIPA